MACIKCCAGPHDLDFGVGKRKTYKHFWEYGWQESQVTKTAQLTYGLIGVNSASAFRSSFKTLVWE